MKVCTKCNVGKSSSEFNKRSLSKDGLNSRCRDCMKVVKAKDYQDNKEKISVIHKQYRLDNNEHIVEYRRKYYIENKDCVDEKNKQWRLDNLAQAKETNAKWKREHKGAVNAYCAIRRAAKLLRTPSWLTENDKMVISNLYEQAQTLTEETGDVYHVDHIIPLQGDLVSGLHTTDNLQVILAFDNLSKNNSYTM